MQDLVFPLNCRKRGFRHVKCCPQELELLGIEKESGLGSDFMIQGGFAGLGRKGEEEPATASQQSEVGDPRSLRGQTALLFP